MLERMDFWTLVKFHIGFDQYVTKERSVLNRALEAGFLSCHSPAGKREMLGKSCNPSLPLFGSLLTEGASMTSDNSDPTLPQRSTKLLRDCQLTSNTQRFQDHG